MTAERIPETVNSPDLSANVLLGAIRTLIREELIKMKAVPTMSRRQLRESRGLSLDELASRSGVQRNTISALERGKTKRPHSKVITRVAMALGIQPGTYITAARGDSDGK